MSNVLLKEDLINDQSFPANLEGKKKYYLKWITAFVKYLKMRKLDQVFSVKFHFQVRITI